ncbi:MAG: M23 family metallopeptidase [Candidatus Subteraquimicrobiales bacterium]|nr:M23 family metallopeptidase [Candidatus Subteraquimicrobiales bacterium]
MPEKKEKAYINRQVAQKRRRKNKTIIASILILFLLFAYKAFTKDVRSANQNSQIVEKKEESSSLSQVKQAKFFARVSSYEDLELYYPLNPEEVIGVGFHQASNDEALSLQPVGLCLVDETTATVRSYVASSKVPVLFVMNTRGRGTSLTSAADVAVKPGSLVRSPVDGVVTLVKKYYLYGRHLDYQIEIRPDGYSNLRVVIIHVEELSIKESERVIRGKTLIGKVNAFSRLQAQMERYLPGKFDHVHIQVNPVK